MSTNKQTILVIGATGNQGGSVVRYLQTDTSFTVKAMVRDPTAQKALQLKSSGCQVCCGDLNNVDSMVKAMKGVYGVFAVTNFWDPEIGYEGEIRQGKNIADACCQAGIQHIVWSTLDRNSGTPHFDSKVQIEDYMRQLKLPLTCLVTSFYFENLMNFFPPKRHDNELVFTVAQKPTTHVPMYSVYDTGGWVLQAFKHPEKYLHQDLAAVSQYLSYPELVQTFTQVTSEKARFDYLHLDVFRTFGFPGCEELANNLKFFDDVWDGLKEDRRVNLTNSCKIFRGETWEGFLRRTKWTG